MQINNAMLMTLEVFNGGATVNGTNQYFMRF